MVFFLTLFLVFWALIYTSARFLKYFRIVKDYKDKTTATVLRVSDHEPVRKKETPAIDVVLGYTIDGKEGSTEVVVPVSQADKYVPGTEVEICYNVLPNGTVNIASAGDGPKRMMYGYLGAIVLELVIYYVIWRLML